MRTKIKTIYKEKFKIMLLKKKHLYNLAVCLWNEFLLFMFTFLFLFF